MCVASLGNLHSGAALVVDLTVIEVQVGTLGEGVISTQTDLPRVLIILVQLVEQLTTNGLQRELADRSLQANKPGVLVRNVAGAAFVALENVIQSRDFDNAKVVGSGSGGHPGLAFSIGRNDLFVVQTGADRAVVVGTHDGVQGTVARRAGGNFRSTSGGIEATNFGSGASNTVTIGFVRIDCGCVSEHDAEAGKFRADVGDGVGSTINLDGHLGEVADSAIGKRIEGTEDAVTNAVQVAADDGTETTGQADVGVTVGPGSGLVATGVLINRGTVFDFEDCLQAIAQVFNTLETDAAAGLNAGGDFVLAFGIINGTGTAIAVHTTQVSTTVDGDIGLRKGSGGGQASDSQGDQFLLH